MLTNPAGTAYAKYMSNRITTSNKPLEDIKPKGLMGMMRKQPKQPKKTLEPAERAQEMFNQVRDQRKKLQNGRA
tara:strand:- start:389 stop:610 length:222 start_codon:yes stop_codon:yes gene_type:complete